MHQSHILRGRKRDSIPQQGFSCTNLIRCFHFNKDLFSLTLPGIRRYLPKHAKPAELSPWVIDIKSANEPIMDSKSQLKQTHQTQELVCITLEELVDLSHGLFYWPLLRVHPRFCLHVNLCTVCVQCPHWPEEGVRSLGLELHWQLWDTTRAGSQTWVSWKISQCS